MLSRKPTKKKLMQQRVYQDSLFPPFLKKKKITIKQINEIQFHSLF